MGFNSFQNNGGDWMQSAGKNAVAQSVASKTIAGVYGWMAFGVLLSAMVGMGLIQSGGLQAILSMGSGVFIALMIVQIGLVIGMSFAANKLSATALKGMFLLYASLTGITFATIMVIYPIGNVVALFAVAALGFTALAVFGAVTKKNLGFMSTFLMMGLFMIIGVGIINMFVHSEMLRTFTGWAGILVFSGLTAYDSQRIREGAYSLSLQSAGDSQAMGKFMIFGALTMYLNFINLFISLLQIFGGRKD
ncbi:Bax inhibitor-1/YccA family protein [Fluviispira multicolorata]|nr:Bax inhibitor-1/YccA family protein [Fluviispira multicolorata]